MEYKVYDSPLFDYAEYRVHQK